MHDRAVRGRMSEIVPAMHPTNLVGAEALK
jgi:hypothetical protein